MNKKNWLCGLLAVLSSFNVFAENRPGAFTISVGDGYYHFSQLRDFDNTWVPNMALAYNFDKHWAGEVMLGLINTNINPPTVLVKEGVHGYLGMLDAIYRFNPYWRFEPYVTAGLGIMSVKPNGYDPQNQGNINAGIGTQFFVVPYIAFRVEARDIYTLSGGKNDYMLNVSMSFLLGGEQQPAPKNYKGE